jgi:hypothetical protein
MYRRILTIAAISAGVLVSGGAALAVANSVSTTPDAQFISHTDKSGVSDHPDVTRPDRRRAEKRPVTVPTFDDKGGERTGSDDPATHDVTDDHGNDNVAPAPVSPVTVDDHGGMRSGSDDPATHDVTDDHGNDNTPPASVSPVTVDDHGGSRHGGSGGGSDDGPSHK